MEITLWQAVLLGIVEGLTEYLPVSSTGHLTIFEKLLGLSVNDATVTAYTAIIQIGAIAAAVIYFWKDIVTVVTAFVRGVLSAPARQTREWRFACTVIVGSIPIAIAGLALQNVIEGPLRSLWVVAGGLIIWSGVMVFAERAATHQRDAQDLRLADGLIIGLVQIFSLIPGVSRSGATISAGLLRDLDRVTATRLSFLLGIPALSAAGLFEAWKTEEEISAHGLWTATIVGIVVSFLVAYASIVWLLRFVSRNSLMPFVWYRVVLGVGLLLALATGLLTAT